MQLHAFVSVQAEMMMTEESSHVLDYPCLKGALHQEVVPQAGHLARMTWKETVFKENQPENHQPGFFFSNFPEQKQKGILKLEITNDLICYKVSTTHFHVFFNVKRS